MYFRHEATVLSAPEPNTVNNGNRLGKYVDQMTCEYEFSEDSILPVTIPFEAFARETGESNRFSVLGLTSAACGRKEPLVCEGNLTAWSNRTQRKVR